jgi:hypothetical protein
LDVHPARWLRTRDFSEQHTGKTRLFYFFMHVNLLSAFSLYWIFWLFSRVWLHLSKVGSLTSKLPSFSFEILRIIET